MQSKRGMFAREYPWVDFQGYNLLHDKITILRARKNIPNRNKVSSQFLRFEEEGTK